MTKGIEQPNQAKIRMLGEKETYKYFGILEVDTIKQVEIKKKIEKSILRERRNNMKPNYLVNG